VRLAIVGNTILVGSKEAWIAVQDTIKRLKPSCVISGGATGVDTMAEVAAKQLGVKFEAYLPEQEHWHFYKKRNVLIATDCEHLVRVFTKRAKTYGSGWTADYARKLGKTVEDIEIS